MSEEKNDDSEGNNFIDDLKETVKTRFSNPFFFSYLFSWIILNWRFISFMFFSNKTIEEKLSEYGSYIDFWGWVYPLLGVGLYLLGLNYIDSFFLFIGKHGYKRKVDELKNRSSIKIQAEVEIAQEKIDLQAKKIKADQVDTLLKETERLNTLLEETEKASKKKDSTIADLKRERDSNKSNVGSIQLGSKITYPTASQFNLGGMPSRSLEEIEKLLEEGGLINDFISMFGNNSFSYIGLGDYAIGNSENADIYRKLGLVDNFTTTLTELGRKMIIYLKAGRPEPFIG